MVCLDSSAIGAASDRSLGLPNGHYRQRVDSKASSRTSHLPNPITLAASRQVLANPSLQSFQLPALA
jgi:hypothetical protein